MGADCRPGATGRRKRRNSCEAAAWRMRSRRGTSASNRRRPAAGNSWPGRGSGRRASGKLGLLDADDYGARPVVASLVAGRVDDLRLSQGETARIVRPFDRRRFAGIVAEDGLVPDDAGVAVAQEESGRRLALVHRRRLSVRHRHLETALGLVAATVQRLVRQRRDADPEAHRLFRHGRDAGDVRRRSGIVRR